MNRVPKNTRTDNSNQNEPNTLWDLEIEKESADRARGLPSAKRAMCSRPLIVSISELASRRRRDLSIDMSLINQNLLAVATSPGVFLPPLDNKRPSTVDFAFVLNVREAELYPPLLLAQDISCAKQLIANNQKFYKNNIEKLSLEILERNALRDCIEQRLPNLSPHEAKFEPQIIITRLSITCTCDAMRTGEKCSALNQIDKQQWTEFMGNLNNGVF